MAAPSMEEKMLIVQFRKRVADVLLTDEQKSDMFLIRWLRARDLNMDKTEKMLRHSLQWRQDLGVDKVLQKDFDEFFHKTYPFSVDGVDNEGRPVLVFPFGKWDVRKALEMGKQDEYIQYINYFFELITDKIRKAGTHRSNPNVPHSQFVAIVDFDGISMRQFANIGTLKNLLAVAQTYEAHYPEVVFRVFFINCSTVFTLFYRFLKPVLAAKTVEKISIHSTNRSEWEPEICKVMNMSEGVKFPLGGGGPSTEDSELNNANLDQLEKDLKLNNH